MSERIEIDVRHVTRVEGHGNVRVRATDGVIEEVRWEIPEAPRFFEAMCRGRSWEDVQTVVSRICGICSVTHSLAAIKAIEAAFGIEVSPQTDKLRILTHYGEQIESHVLHVGYLVSPDLLGAKSVIPLASSHRSGQLNRRTPTEKLPPHQASSYSWKSVWCDRPPHTTPRKLQ